MLIIEYIYKLSYGCGCIPTLGGGKSGIGGITSKVEKPEFSLQGISKNMQVLEGGDRKSVV